VAVSTHTRMYANTEQSAAQRSRGHARERAQVDGERVDEAQLHEEERQQRGEGRAAGRVRKLKSGEVVKWNPHEQAHQRRQRGRGARARCQHSSLRGRGRRGENERKQQVRLLGTSGAQAETDARVRACTWDGSGSSAARAAPGSSSSMLSSCASAHGVEPWA
jgi:hypothetical protein